MIQIEFSVGREIEQDDGGISPLGEQGPDPNLEAEASYTASHLETLYGEPGEGPRYCEKEIINILADFTYPKRTVL